MCRRTARCTGHAHCADGRRSRSDEFQVLECKVAYEDGLADTQFGYVHDQFVGQVLDQRAHDELTGRQRQLTADLHTFGVTRQAYRNGDGYGFTLGNAVEIEVEDLLADGVELRLTQHGLLFLAVEIELDDVRVGGVDQGLDLAGVYREGNRLAVARQYAGYHTLAAYGLGRFLAVLITLNGLYRDSFHNTFVF